MRWRYAKDGGGASGDDRGYVDTVAFQPAGPVFMETPSNVSIQPNQNVTLRVAASAASTTIADVTRPGDRVVPTSTNSPNNEQAANALDNSAATKYFNSDKFNSGFTVFPSGGLTVVTGLKFVAANDAPERDPTSYALFGSTDGSNYRLISQGAIPKFFERGQLVSVSFANNTAYTSYRLTFPTIEDLRWENRWVRWGPFPWQGRYELVAVRANGMQIAEVEFLGVPPLSYQWRRDGVNIAGATNATLVVTNVTLAQAGAHTVVAQDSAGQSSTSAAGVVTLAAPSGSNAGPQLPLAGGAEVRVFNDSRYVDAGADISTGELTNLVSSLTSLGFRPVGFSGTAFGAARVVIVPKLERGTPSLSAAEKLAWANFVRQGGSIIVLHGEAARWLNSFLGTALSAANASGTFSRAAGATTTEFADDAASLTLIGSGQALSAASLPSGSRQIYASGSNVAVATFLVDAGRVTYLEVELVGEQQCLRHEPCFLDRGEHLASADHPAHCGRSATQSLCRVRSGRPFRVQLWRSGGRVPFADAGQLHRHDRLASLGLHVRRCHGGAADLLRRDSTGRHDQLGAALSWRWTALPWSGIGRGHHPA